MTKKRIDGGTFQVCPKCIEPFEMKEEMVTSIFRRLFGKITGSV